MGGGTGLPLRRLMLSSIEGLSLRAGVMASMMMIREYSPIMASLLGNESGLPMMRRERVAVEKRAKRKKSDARPEVRVDRHTGTLLYSYRGYA